MNVFINNNNNFKFINISYKKLKINNLFLIHDYIIFIKADAIFYLKDKIINNDILSLGLNNNFIKALFKLPNYYFLKGGNFYCIFVKNFLSFINIITILEKKNFFIHLNIVSVIWFLGKLS